MSINRSGRMGIVAAVLAALGALGSTAIADSNPSPSPYAGEQQRAVKSLSAQDIGDLEAGHGMGLSKVAELNHFPGPKHVLDLAPALHLTEGQMQKIRQQQDDMQQQAQRLGREIIARESMLDALFASRHAEADAVHKLLAEIAQLQGDLRFTHVKAHLATAQLLSQEQIAAYDQLRGYADGAMPEHMHHHH